MEEGSPRLIGCPTFETRPVHTKVPIPHALYSLADIQRGETFVGFTPEDQDLTQRSYSTKLLVLLQDNDFDCK